MMASDAGLTGGSNGNLSHMRNERITDEVPHGTEARIRGLRELPPLPAVAQHVMEQLSDENVSIDRLAAVIEQDPGLMARIVGVANSAYFGSRETIYSVSDAILRVLGLNLVKSLTLGIVLSGPLRPRDCEGFRPDHYWFTAVATAALARKLAPQVPGGDARLAEHAYLCGLLHNLGTLVLASLFPAEYAAALAEAGSGEELSRRLREGLGIDPSEAGDVLTRRWHLPDSVGTVMVNHGNAHYRGSHWRLSTLVGLCAHLAAEQFDGVTECRPTQVYLDSLKLDADRVCAEAERLRSQSLVHYREEGAGIR